MDYFLASKKYVNQEINAPIIHAYDCKNIKLVFHIVDAEKINPNIIE